MGFELTTPYFAVVGFSERVNRLRYRAEPVRFSIGQIKWFVALKTQ